MAAGAVTLVSSVRFGRTVHCMDSDAGASSPALVATTAPDAGVVNRNDDFMEQAMADHVLEEGVLPEAAAPMGTPSAEGSAAAAAQSLSAPSKTPEAGAVVVSGKALQAEVDKLSVQIKSINAQIKIGSMMRCDCGASTPRPRPAPASPPLAGRSC